MPAGRGRWCGRHGAVAGALILLLVASGGAAMWRSAVLDSDLEDVAAAAEAVSDDLAQVRSSAISVLASAAEAVGITDPSAKDGGAGQVDEVLADASASTLAEAVAAAGDDQLRVPDADGPWLQRAERLDALRAYAVTAAGLADELSTSTVALSDSLTAWQLAQATTSVEQARADLDAALASARTTLDESAERVLDDSSRWALTDAITATQAVRDAAVDPQDVDALTQAATDLTAQIEPLNAAVSAVSAATVAWQGEQDRLAAEQQAAAAAAQQAASTSSGSTKNSGTGSATSSAKSGSSAGSTTKSGTGKTGSSSTGSSSTGTSSSDGGSTWVESESGFGSDLCFDTSGNSWEC